MSIPLERSQSASYEMERMPTFGAFVQVFVKKTDAQGIPRIACLSYPLPPITSSQAKEALVGIAGEHILNRKATFYESPSQELMFLALPGGQFDTAVLRRFMDVPGEMFHTNQSERKRELLGGVLKEFDDELSGIRHESAQASSGKNIFSLSYRLREEDAGLYGKDRQGNEGKRLSELSMEGDLEHKGMLEELEQQLVTMEDGIILHIDKSKTVLACCARFFEEKLQKGSAQSGIFSFYFGDVYPLTQGWESGTCEQCGVAIAECNGHVTKEKIMPGD